jgi:aryl-alcohol dehydrogenase-like predicted oxidoreductase
MGSDPNQRGGSRRWIRTAVEDSLRWLGTDHIDLYQMHRPDPVTDMDETLSALSDLIRSGKVRAIGSSFFSPEQTVEAQWAAERGGHHRLRTEQPPYSILTRGFESSVLPDRTALRHGCADLRATQRGLAVGTGGPCRRTPQRAWRADFRCDAAGGPGQS